MKRSPQSLQCDRYAIGKRLLIWLAVGVYIVYIIYQCVIHIVYTLYIIQTADKLSAPSMFFEIVLQRLHTKLFALNSAIAYFRQSVNNAILLLLGLKFRLHPFKNDQKLSLAPSNGPVYLNQHKNVSI